MIKTKIHHEQQTKTKIIPVTKQSKQNTKLTKTQYLHTTKTKTTIIKLKQPKQTLQRNKLENDYELLPEKKIGDQSKETGER